MKLESKFKCIERSIKCLPLVPDYPALTSGPEFDAYHLSDYAHLDQCTQHLLHCPDHPHTCPTKQWTQQLGIHSCCAVISKRKKERETGLYGTFI